MTDEAFKAGQRVKRKADERILRCLGEVEGKPGRYLCTWMDDGVLQQAEYDHAELGPFQFAGFITVRTGAHRNPGTSD